MAKNSAHAKKNTRNLFARANPSIVSPSQQWCPETVDKLTCRSSSFLRLYRIPSALRPLPTTSYLQSCWNLAIATKIRESVRNGYPE